MDSSTSESLRDKPATTQATAAAVLDAWLSPGRFALLLAALIVAFFPDSLLMGKTFVFRDFGIFTYPNAYFQRESFWRGEFPLWNPLNNCGIPFLAQWNTVCLYPLTLIYVLLPLTWGLTFFLLLHLFVAGFGMYLLASHWTKSRLAAAVAGVAFAFNGLILNCLMWSSNLAALAWMPWVVLAVERAFMAGQRRQIITAALVSAVQILAGAPEIIVFTWLVLLLLWVHRLIAQRDSRARAFVRVVGIVIVAALLSAAQLLPFAELLAHSERTAAYGNNMWMIPLWGWANLFLPLFHCYRSPLGVYFQPFQDWTSSYYLGVGVLALGLAAVLFVRTPRVWMLAACTVFGFAVALGDPGHLYSWLLKGFPPLGFMRYPIKFAFLAVFSVPLLAAYAVAWCRKAQASDLKPAMFRLALSAAFVAAVVVGVFCHTRLYPFPREELAVLLPNGLLRILFLVLVVAAIWLYGRTQNARHQSIIGILLVTLFWMDVATHAPRQNPTADPSIFTPGVFRQRMSPAPQPSEARALMTKSSQDLVCSWMLAEPEKDYLGRRGALLGDGNILDDIPVADGFYSLYVREQRSLFSQFFYSPTNAFSAGFADFLGISQMSDPDKVLGWLPRPSHLPLCSVGARPEFVVASNMPALLVSKEFDPRKVVYLPPEARPHVAVTNQVEATIRSKRFSAQRIDLEVEAPASTLLVLAQANYPAWQAQVNGQPARIWTANYAFQAIVVPQGKSTVNLVYHDQRFRTGLAVSVLALLGCLVGLVSPRRRTPAQSPGAGSPGAA